MLPRGQTQFAVIVNCDGFGPSKTPPLAMVKTAFIAMQKHYPMRLGYVVMVNAAGPIALVWKVRHHFFQRHSSFGPFYFRWSCGVFRFLFLVDSLELQPVSLFLIGGVAALFRGDVAPENAGGVFFLWV